MCLPKETKEPRRHQPGACSTDEQVNRVQYIESCRHRLAPFLGVQEATGPVFVPDGEKETECVILFFSRPFLFLVM